MKQLYQLFLTVCVLFCFSCEKNQETITPDAPSGKSRIELIDLAKRKYEKESQKKDGQAKQPLGKKSANKSIHWKKSFVQKIKDNSFLVTPITVHTSPYTYLADGVKVSLSDMTVLVTPVFTDSLGSFEVLTKLPDRAYLQSEESYPEFTGLVLVDDMYGNYKKGFEINGVTGVHELAKGATLTTKPTKTTSNQKPTTECSIIDWYSCTGGETMTCTYLYTESFCWGGGGTATPTNGATYGTIGQGSYSGSGTATSTPPPAPGSTPTVGGNGAGLCAGTLQWTKGGNSWYADINNLGVIAVYNGEPDPIHAPSGPFIQVFYGAACVQIPGYNLTSQEASREFAAIFNHASRWIDRELDSGELRPTYTAIKSRLTQIIKSNLNSIHPGATFSPNPCTGGIPVSTAGYGC